MTKQVLGRDEALRLLREHMPVLRERFGVTSVALFGSTARDEASADSDVDVLVQFDREPEAAWGSYEARTYLSEVLGRRVDMVERHRMRREYLPWVEADAIDPLNVESQMPQQSAPKRWDVYVEDMIDACQQVLRYTEGVSRDDFFADIMRYDATIRQLEVLGEAANRISDEVHEAHPEIPWRKIVDNRNYLIHGYDGIKPDELWGTISESVPRLAPRLPGLLAEARAAIEWPGEMSGGIPDKLE